MIVPQERLIRCDQDLQSFNQKVYDMSTEMRGQVRSVNVLKSEIQGHVDSLALRVDRVERDVEYLQNKIPDSSNVEIEESILEQQVQEAQQKKRVVITQGKGINLIPFSLFRFSCKSDEGLYRGDVKIMHKGIINAFGCIREIKNNNIPGKSHPVLHVSKENETKRTD